MPDEPIFWSVTKLLEAFRSRALSPVEVARGALDRISALDGQLHSYLTLTEDLALEQARQAEKLYRAGGSDFPALLGVPVSIKDLFDVRGEPTSLGSRVYRGTVAQDDSQPVARLRAAGAVFLGKSNTAEFGQSATTENLLGPGCGNPWDATRTAGGSSGGAAAGVGAGLAVIALGSDGGGSIRIPAALCGMFGLKPTLDTPAADSSFRAMTDFVCPGPIARTVADARAMLSVLLDRPLLAHPPARLRIAWSPNPEGRPVSPDVLSATQNAVAMLAKLGHAVEEVALPIDGWMDAFGPLVLADEWRYRRHLLDDHAQGLTDYARRTIQAAERVTDGEIETARALKAEVRQRVEAMFDRFDLIVTPTTATLAFPIGQRPVEINGQKVSGLWGPFPFTAPFNVAGSPAASIPVAIADGLPVGLQIVGPAGGERRLLDVCEQLEAAVGFPIAEMKERWRMAPAAEHPEGVIAPRPAVAPTSSRGAPELLIERHERVAVLRLNRPQKRNALSTAMLERLRVCLAEAAADGAVAVVLTGNEAVFSAGMDLTEIGRGLADLEVDETIAATTAAIRELSIPVIAAIEGVCLGAALDIALACDVRVAGADARFGVPAARLGVLYRPESIGAMMNVVGQETAARLLVLGDLIPAEQAATARLVSRVVPAGDALAVALTSAQASAASPNRAVAATKQLINHLARSQPGDLGPWEGQRRELLASPERQSSLTAARARLGVSATTEATN